MFWLILSIILAIIGGIGLLVGLAGHRDLKRGASGIQASDSAEMRAWGFAAFGVCLAVWIAVSMLKSIHIIPAGHVGVVYGFAGGKIVGHMDNGTNFTWPWQDVKKGSAQVQKAEFRLLPDTDAGPAVSSEAQPIYARLTVNYQVDPRDVVELYRNVGPNWFHVLVEGRVLQDFKEITAKYKSVEITPHREEIRVKFRDQLRKEMAKYSISIVDVQISNLGFPKAFEDAILAKQVQTQKAQEAQAKVSQARFEGEQSLVKARNEAKANKLLSASISPNLVRLRAIETLNPQAQVIYVPAGANLFLPGGQVTPGK